MSHGSDFFEDDDNWEPSGNHLPGKNREVWWLTKDLRYLRISEMPLSHLSNTVAMLRRKGFTTKREYMAMARVYLHANPRGEGAQDALEEEFSRFLRYAKANPSLEAMEQELERRKRL